MSITVHLYGQLRDKVPRENKGKIVLEHTPNMRVKDAMTSLSIGEDNLITLSDSKEIDFNYELNAGDILYVFPPVSGG